MSTFSHPELSPVEIAEELNANLAPSTNLRPEDIANPQADLLPSVLALFFASVVGEDIAGEQLGLDVLEGLDNPKHHAKAIRELRLYKRARDFFDSIKFGSFTLRDLSFPDRRRVALILGALVNFLHFREDRLSVLQPVLSKLPNNKDERFTELRAKIAQNEKAIEDHALAVKMEEPMVLQLEEEVNALKQKIQKYNKQQMALRTKANTLNDKKKEIEQKTSQAEFELMQLVQENVKLSSKIVQSPEKLQRALEEKKASRIALKNSERMAMQSVQEKTATLDIYNKFCRKLTKHSSKIEALLENVAATENLEKEVKTRNAKINDQIVSIIALDAKIIEREGKARKMEEHLKAKERERDQRIADENQKHAALKSEIELKHQCLELIEGKVEATDAKAAKLCSEADSVRAAATAKQQKIHAKFQDIVHGFECYMNTVNPSFERIEEMAEYAMEDL